MSLDGARAEMEALAAALAERYPDTNGHNGVALLPLREWLVGSVRPSLLLLLAAVCLLLAIACSNVANLMLARASEELAELRIRVALGARGRHLLRRVFLECLLLAAAGGAGGWLLAAQGLDLLLPLVPDSLPRQEAIALDGRVLAFAVLTTVVTALAFGVLPSVVAGRRSRETQALVGTGSRTTPTSAAGRVLVIAETALAVLLLVGAGLLVRSLLHAVAVDPGFEPEGVLTARLELPAWQSQDGDAAAVFHRRLLEEVRGMPGVTSAALATGLPMAGGSEWGFWPAGRPMPDPPRPEIAVGYAVSAGYFDTLGIDLLAGRAIDKRDGEGARRVCVVDERLAARFFPDGSAVGEALVLDPDLPPLEIVGVARHVRHYGLDTEGPVDTQVYVAAAQEPEGDRAAVLASAWLAVRTGGALEPFGNALRARVHELDPEVSLYRVRPYGAVVGARLAARRFTLTLLVLFAAAAAGLSATGAAVGLLGSLFVGELVEGLLFGVSAHDPPTYGAILALLLAVAATASLPPATRAARSDPRTTLS